MLENAVKITNRRTFAEGNSSASFCIPKAVDKFSITAFFKGDSLEEIAENLRIISVRMD